MRVPCFEGLYPLAGCGVISDGGIDVWGWRRGQACAPGPPCAPYTAFSPHVSRSSFFGKVLRVKYAGFTRQALHPLQAGIMSSNALTILPSGYWAPRTMVDFAA